MQTTRELYQAAKTASGVKSDYQFSQRYGMKTPTVSRWSNGKASFDDESADLIAKILKVDAGYVMACAHAERTKSEKSRTAWARLAALALAASLSGGASAALNQAPASYNSNSIGIMLNYVAIQNGNRETLPYPGYEVLSRQ